MILDHLYRWASMAALWAIANPEWSIPFAVYLIANVMPRRPPKNPKWHKIWAFSERFMFLAWNLWGGRFKALGIVYPEPPED
jgi:hypothetical protein